MSSKPKPPEGYATWIDFAADQLRLSSEYAALQNELADLRRAKELLLKLVSGCDVQNSYGCFPAGYGHSLDEARAYLAAEQEQRDGQARD